MNIVLIAKGLLFMASYLVCIYFTGSAFGYFIKEKYTYFQKVAVGFVLNLALIELMGWFFVAFRMQVLYFVILVVVIGVLGIMAGLIAQKRGKILGASKAIIVHSSRGRTINPIVIAVAMLVFQIMVTAVLYRSDADDSFYVSNATLFSNSKYLNLYDSSMGSAALGTVPMYDFQIWESLLAVFCKVFQIEAVVLMHTLIIPMLLVVSACAYLYLGYVLFQDKVKAYYFYVLISVFHLMGGNTGASQGSFLLSRIWQGKAVYLHIVIPVLMAFILGSIEKQTIQRNWKGFKRIAQEDGYIALKVVACVLAGVSLNPTSLYMIGFLLLFMMIPVSIKRRQPRFLLNMVPSVGAIAFFCWMIYSRTNQYSGQIEASSVAGANFVGNVFLRFWKGGIAYFLIYMLLLIVIIKFGDTKARVCFLWTPLLMLCFIWNPIMGRIVAQSVTMVPSYWRVFWLIPAGMAIAYSIIILAFKVNKKYLHNAILIAGVLILAIPGKWMFTSGTRFIYSNNVEKVPNEVLIFGEELLAIQQKDIVVLACNAFATTVRQKYSNIELVYSRKQYILDLIKYRDREVEAEERIRLFDFSEGRLAEKDMSDLFELFETYRINWIILKTDNTAGINYLEKVLGIMETDKTEKYILYQIN